MNPVHVEMVGSPESGRVNQKGGIMYDNKPYTQHDIVCPHCQAKQSVHMAVMSAGSVPLETVTCVNPKCGQTFDMPVAGKILGGPWPFCSVCNKEIITEGTDREDFEVIDSTQKYICSKHKTHGGNQGGYVPKSGDFPDYTPGA